MTGPDEYHERVHNNALTNRMVAHTLEVCLQLADHLQQTAPAFGVALVTRLDFEADMAFMTKVVNKLYRPDATDDLIPQFDGYFSLENVSVKALLQRKLNPHEYLGGGNGLTTNTQITKQADVVLMLHLFGEDYSRATNAANWEYYEPRTEHGSSLSACSYSLIAAQIGKVAWAYKYFMKTATIDLTGIGKQYVGTLYIGGKHPAGNGGAWMAAVLGLCGIRCEGDTVFVDAYLPEQWQKVTLPLTFHGQKLRLILTKTDVTVERVTASTKALAISVNETVYPLPEGGEMRVGWETAVILPLLETATTGEA